MHGATIKMIYDTGLRVEIEGAYFNLPSVPAWYTEGCPSYSSDKDETITISMPSPLYECIMTSEFIL